MSDTRTVTTVEIAGEEYTIRSEASSDYTLECARLVNQTISEIRSRGSLVEVHKAAILAAMALADQLYQAREERDRLRSDVAERASRILAEIDRRTPASDLASSD
ncbi:MAG TPA: cell division protein ZapA [Longimicrobiales bacterium]|nr:cell division protein ZapA [Longimicrobiales bacterium]